MRKAPYLILIIFLTTFIHHGKAQQSEENRRIALSFFSERMALHRLMNGISPTIQSVIPVETDGQTTAYAYNFRDGGWVLASASDNTFPVLGYSLKGEYGNSTPPDALLAWLRYYGRQTDAANSYSEPAEAIRQMRQKYLSGTTLHHSTSGRAVEPMLQTNWDQGKFYNGMCPTDPNGPNGRCYAGCVATAVGQLMFYHRWPEQGSGEYSYLHPVYGEQYANFGEANYNWNGMETSLNGPNHDIAQLLYHLGISFDMDYGPNGSGMWNHSAANSMRNFFKYGPNTQYIFRDTTTMNWDSILIANLDARKPLYYAGWDSINPEVGHAFVCDGYAPDNFYHFDWGWSGSYNGFFLLSALTPGGNNFNFHQEVIKDIYPDTTLYNYPVYCENGYNLNTIAGTFSDGSNMLNYPAGLNCMWEIRPDDPDYDSIVSINIRFPALDLADGDVIRVYAGTDISAPPIAEISGNEPPATIEIPYHIATVTLDAPNGNANGFLAAYNSTMPIYCTGTTTFNETSGILNDGSGDKNYSNNTLCKWRIMPQQAVPLTITFDEFNTESGKDFLKIYDLGNQNLIASLSGDTLPGPINIESGRFYLIFNSDESGTAPGWILNWEPQSTVNTQPIHPVNEFSLYPTPADEVIYLRSSVSELVNVIATIYAVDGRALKQHKLSNFDSSITAISLSDLSPGLYLMHIDTGSRRQALKFIKGGSGK